MVSESLPQSLPGSLILTPQSALYSCQVTESPQPEQGFTLTWLHCHTSALTTPYSSGQEAEAAPSVFHTALGNNSWTEESIRHPGIQHPKSKAMTVCNGICKQKKGRLFTKASWFGLFDVSLFFFMVVGFDLLVVWVFLNQGLTVQKITLFNNY